MNGYGHPWYPPRRGRHGFRGAPFGRRPDLDRRERRGAVAGAAPARRRQRSAAARGPRVGIRLSAGDYSRGDQSDSRFRWESACVRGC